MNLLLTATNAARNVTNFLGLSKRQSIKGLPLGTSDDTDTGEIAVKVKVVGVGSVSFSNGSQLPYGADQQVISYVGSTNNIDAIIYKLSGSTLMTRTFTYIGGTPNSDDALLAGTQDA